MKCRYCGRHAQIDKHGRTEEHLNYMKTAPCPGPTIEKIRERQREKTRMVRTPLELTMLEIAMMHNGSKR